MGVCTSEETLPVVLSAPAPGDGEVCQPQTALGHLRTQHLTDPQYGEKSSSVLSGHWPMYVRNSPKACCGPALLWEPSA